MNEGPFCDFISAFFHRFNNLVGSFYGKLELIVVYKKEETQKKLPQAEVLHFLETMRELREWLLSPESFEMAKRLTGSGQGGILKEFFSDRQGRFSSTLLAAEGDPALRNQIDFFFKEAGAGFPETPRTLDTAEFPGLFEYAQKLLGFSREGQARWFDGSGRKML